MTQCRFVLINLAEVFAKFTGSEQAAGGTMAEAVRVLVQMAHVVEDSNE